MELLSQNGDEFSGVAAGLLGVLPIITGNCSQFGKTGGKDAKEVKRYRGKIRFILKFDKIRF